MKIILVIVNLLLLGLGAASLYALPTIAATIATPSTIGVNSPTKITITSMITDTLLSPASVRLFRLPPFPPQLPPSPGDVTCKNSPCFLGELHDDGQNGDAAAGDKVYTLQLMIIEPAVGPVQLRVSAAFLGLTLSSTVTLQVANSQCPRAANTSTSTLCAEEDNINSPMSGRVISFVIEASPPTYPIGSDSCKADITNCTSDPGVICKFTADRQTLFNDGETIVEAVREACWWRPNGMDASANRGTPMKDIHYVILYKKIRTNDFRQFLVLYMDGNLRLIPLPSPPQLADVCFGSSVIVGAAAPAARPTAEIASVDYSSIFRTLDINYKQGGAATLSLQQVDSALTRVGVAVNYPTDVLPFATFRSMFITDGNADVDHVLWKDTTGTSHDDPILAFPGGIASEWLFCRSTRSVHNTSAPDIRVKTLACVLSP